MESKIKEIELGDRKFRIKKFDARTGSYMMVKLMGILSPLLGLLAGPKKEEDINYTETLAPLMKLPEEDFRYIQDKCLGVCYEVLPSGETKVLDSNNTFAVLGLEDDTATVMALTVHAVMWNISSFFGGNLSIFSGIMGKLDGPQ